MAGHLEMGGYEDPGAWTNGYNPHWQNDPAAPPAVQPAAAQPANYPTSMYPPAAAAPAPPAAPTPAYAAPPGMENNPAYQEVRAYQDAHPLDAAGQAGAIQHNADMNNYMAAMDYSLQRPGVNGEPSANQTNSYDQFIRSGYTPQQATTDGWAIGDGTAGWASMPAILNPTGVGGMPEYEPGAVAAGASGSPSMEGGAGQARQSKYDPTKQSMQNIYGGG